MTRRMMKASIPFEPSERASGADLTFATPDPVGFEPSLKLHRWAIASRFESHLAPSLFEGSLPRTRLARSVVLSVPSPPAHLRKFDGPPIMVPIQRDLLSEAATDGPIAIAALLPARPYSSFLNQ